LGNYNSGDTITTTNAPTTSGKLESFRQKNIYDMAGNVWEWTMEKVSNNSNYILRGGSYGRNASEYPSSYRHSYSTNTSEAGAGFRIGLYLK